MMRAEEMVEIIQKEEQQDAKQRAKERRRQAKIILDVLAEDTINMNWNYEDEYIAAIMKGLKRIEDEKETPGACL